MKLVPDFLQVIAIRGDNVLKEMVQRRDTEEFATCSDDVAHWNLGDLCLWKLFAAEFNSALQSSM